MPNASRPILPQMPPYPPLPNAPAYGKFPRGALDPPPELKLGIKKVIEYCLFWYLTRSVIQDGIKLHGDPEETMQLTV